MNENAMVRISEFERALAEADSLPDIVQIRNAAEAFRQCAKQAGFGREVMNKAAKMRLDAERAAGVMLKGTDLNKGGGDRRSDHRLQGATGGLPTLSELGIERTQSHRWQAEATVPENDYLAYCTEQELLPHGEITAAGLLRLAKKLERKETGDNILIAPPEGKYRAIVIDPPWPIQKIARQERPAQQKLAYATMPIEEIANIPVASLAANDGCHVYLWVTQKYLPAGLWLFEQWTVKYQCAMTWVKPTGMTPFSWMYNTEHVLFGRIGSLKLVQMGLKLSFEAPVTKHSEKPDVFYERVAKASPEPRLELFARKQREGFVIWGDEADG